MEMKAKINNENKAKFFAQYWGQRVLMTPNSDPIDHRSKVCGSIEEYKDACYLSLKPLSSVSDEDAEIIDLGLEDYADVDYLRSKGYAVPWMGLSVEEMVEAGWIKLKEVSNG